MTGNYYRWLKCEFRYWLDPFLLPCLLLVNFCLFSCLSLSVLACFGDKSISSWDWRRRRFRIDTEVRCVGALLPPFGPWSRRGLNPIKPVYDPDRPDGRLNLRASAFNQLRQYTWLQAFYVGATAMQNSPFSFLAVAVTIASSHCAYHRRDGQAELAWVAGYVVRQFTCPKAVTHPSTNRARCRATALIETDALPLH